MKVILKRKRPFVEWKTNDVKIQMLDLFSLSRQLRFVLATDQLKGDSLIFLKKKYVDSWQVETNRLKTFAVLLDDSKVRIKQ